ncbi:ActS/PrrB/RegB family redox-sensitive histidine kinase [Sneathiella limimaris]|uniref:ActS/PrrB/RegB family redox-sensitive histidine kinase n=1 Tax=Sneathiella limimaris TaxID=1964213 RepID=UPI00146DEB19|nr:ActS/PrrB/RegB family redox-sensitive histidine kinase [Sneathiella limimaris]
MSVSTPLEDQAEQKTLLTASGGVRLQSLVYIRWLAILGQAFAIFLVHVGLGYELPIVPASLLVSASAILNVLVSINSRPATRLSDRGAILYLFYDALQLTGLLYLTGGLTNPFSLLFLVPVTISATNLSFKGTIFLGLTTIVAISVLALFHEPLPLPPGEIILSDTYILAIWSALILGTLFLTTYAWRISSDSRRMTEALTAARFALAREQQLSAIGGIAAAAAHELGTPLNTILLVSEELSKDLPEGSDQAEDAKLLHTQAKKCAEVLEQLSTKPDTNRFLQTDAYHNYLPLQSLIELVAERLKDNGTEIQINVHGDTAEQPKLYATPELLYGLGNLVSNAAEFARKLVTIKLEWSDKQVEITIQDDGPGFSDEILNQLGEPYTSSRSGHGGMGLGVFISDMLITHSGGHLNIGNAKSGGARVIITWPRSRLEKANPYL